MSVHAAARHTSSVAAELAGLSLARRFARVMGAVRGRRLAASAFGLVLTIVADLALAVSPGGANAPTATRAPPSTQAAPIDINSASRAQLKTLPGIGEVEADRIISGRPYLSKADLATRDVIPTGVYLSLKGRIIANPRTLPKKVAGS